MSPDTGPGHWEGDMIKGAFGRTSVGTLVERKTRFVILCKMDGNGAEAALEGFTRQMNRLPAMLRKSMTYDRGLEMACHPDLAPPELARASRSTSGSATPMPPGSADRTKTPTAFGTTIDPPDQ